MITLAEAEEHPGAAVLYVPAGGELVEEGVISSSNESYVFVRYGDASGAKATRPDDLMFRGVIPEGMVEVVTRYGGHRHLSVSVKDYPWQRAATPGRFFTFCLGTSSWEIRSWEAHNDHPLNLSIVQMRTLPLCPRCPWELQ